EIIDLKLCFRERGAQRRGRELWIRVPRAWRLVACCEVTADMARLDLQAVGECAAAPRDGDTKPLLHPRQQRGGRHGRTWQGRPHPQDFQPPWIPPARHWRKNLRVHWATSVFGHTPQC